MPEFPDTCFEQATWTVQYSKDPYDYGYCCDAHKDVFEQVGAWPYEGDELCCYLGEAMTDDHSRTV